ncbi:hypothetical protein ACFIJ5_01195 [Haloimpatiens sp. FM7330]|uniref:hypothetical protein n=1 Tax=Haloimpatiens sp. FM7330 TaxID=3298610 RepID=UPI00362D0A6D
MKLKGSKKRKAEVVLANTIRTLLVISMIISIVTHNYLNFFTALLTLCLTFLPFIIAKKNHIKLPPSFQIIILLFIFASQYLGEMKNYYLKFWWWDLMLHTLSGLILGFLGFLLVYILNKEEKVNVYLSPFFMALFAFTFAVSVGALWEIFEFSMDNIFGLNMQKSGLVDTMWDLIVDSIGAIVAAFSGYLYEKNREEGIFKNLITKFLKMNSQLFKQNSKSRDI